MQNRSIFQMVAVGIVFLLSIPGRAESLKFSPIEDAPYLQEIGTKVVSAMPIKSVTVVNGVVFAGTEKGLLRLDGDVWKATSEVTNSVRRLRTTGTNAWALTDRATFVFDGNRWRQVIEQNVADVALYRGEVVMAIGRKVFRYSNGGSVTQIGTNECPFAISNVVSHNESLFVMGAGRIAPFEAGEFGGRDLYDDRVDQAWDWGNLPSPNTRDLLSSGSPLIIATDRGLGVLRGMSLTSLRGADGLPFEDDYCLANGFTNDVWIGTSRGAIRYVGNAFHYFAGERWLPNEKVNAIAVDGRKVYIATDGGLGIIEYVPFTLEAKASFYERALTEWGQKRLGFVQKLEWDEGRHEYVREAGDNDGGYSCDYLAAECFRYAVTHDPVARAEAVNTFQTLRWLRTITCIPGFPARAIWVPGEVGHKATGGSGGYPAEWHPAADGKFEWKGDTSSDELCAHFYATVIFRELVAEGDEKRQAGEHLASIAGHLIDHHWQLIDVDGKPTRWGRWDPEYFLTDEGHYDRGLQCLELLSFMKTAAVVAPAENEKFKRAYDDLVRLGYPKHTLRQRNTFPPDSVLHFEDQLALWSYWNLLRNENDPELYSLYRRSFERTWEVLRIEQQPWFNFVYAALTGNEGEMEAAAAHLREWPLDLRVWSYQNSHRADLQTPNGYVALKAGIRPFSPREREPMRWDGWTMQADGGTGGRDVVEPSGWLHAYWMGRFYGFIKAPASVATVQNISPLPKGIAGARAYNGPPRP